MLKTDLMYYILKVLIPFLIIDQGRALGSVSDVGAGH